MILTVAQIEGFVSVQFQMVEKLKDLCLKQREEIKSLKSSILFPDAMNSHLQGLAEKQGSELIEAKQLIPSLQRQVSSLTGQLKCLAEDLAEVRTIFIFGLPEDVKERELQNLLRWLPGYEASQVNFKGEHPMGFALFATQQHALAAKDALQDMVFDADSKSVLHTEMAKKNLFVKRGIVADSNVYDQSKRMRTGGDYTHSAYSTSPFHPPPPAVWGPHGYMVPAPPPYDPYAGYAVPPAPMPAPSPVPAPSSYVPVQNTKDNPPCNTLFIGNLGENINEEELRGLFSIQPGFKQMKLLRQERHTVCFIEFEDVNSATNVHHSLQGAVIPSSGSIRMRIQYSKNPFGKRKDSSYPGAGPNMNGGLPQMTYQ